MKFKRRILILSTMLGIWPAMAHAHLRNYLDTYGYYTLNKGDSELELFTDRHSPDEGRKFWVQQTEFEYGVTDRYSLGLYGVFTDGVGFSAAKMENRYRFAQPGEWPVDTAVYLEIKDANGRKDKDELEGKIILSKDVGRFNFTTNGILSYERDIEADGETKWEFEKGLTLATAYKTGSRITPGLEVLLEKDQSRITPGLYISLLPEIRLNVGVGFGLVKAADNAQFKSILEIEF